MATYEVTFEGDSYFVECDSMEEAKEEAVSLVDDSSMDWKVEKNGSIAYYDYFVDVIIEKYDDEEDEDDDEEDEDDDEEDEDDQDEDDGSEESRRVVMELIHETECPGECPFCEADDWDDSESVYMHGSTYWHVSTCRKCGAKKEKTSYGKYEKEVNGIWIDRSVVFTEGDGVEEYEGEENEGYEEDEDDEDEE